MKQERLHALLFLFVEQDLTVNVNADNMMDEFKTLIPIIKTPNRFISLKIYVNMRVSHIYISITSMEITQ